MTKRVLSLLLAVLTVFSLCAPAFADEEGTVTEESISTDVPVITEVPAETKEPVEATEEPAETKEPVEATEVPAETEEPVEATEVPAETEEPVEATEEPAETEEPVEATEEPAETKEPVEATEVPAETKEPVEATEEPEATEAPEAEPVDEPVAVADAVHGQVIAHGYCGDEDYGDDPEDAYKNATWALYEDGHLSIGTKGCTSIQNEHLWGDGDKRWCDEKYINKIKTVSIGQGFESIYTGAFSGCKNLTSVSIPSSVTKIWDGAFWGTGLKSVTIPASVKILRGDVFGNCDKLTSVTFAKGFQLTEWGLSETFQGCTSLTSIVIPEGVDEINGTFEGCTSLKSVTLPKSLKSIGGGTFMRCTALTEIAIPEGITYIGANSFYGCKNLKKVNIPKGVTTIYDEAFLYCEKLESIDIPKGVTEIGWHAFHGCKSLKNVTIPEGVNELSPGIFADCDSLETVTILSRECMVSKGEILHRFEDDEPEGLWGPFDGSNPIVRGYSGSLTEDQAKKYKLRFEALDAPATPSPTPKPAGTCGKNLKWSLSDGTLTVSGKGAMANYKNADDPPWSGYEIQKEIRKVVIQNGVTSIGDLAFSWCDNLTSVTIPDSVTSIGMTAFGYCGSLTSVTVPGSVASIGMMAFAGDWDLTSITIQNPDCKIYNANNTLGVSKTTTICGYAGSTAEKYAKSWGYTFKSLGKVPAKPATPKLSKVENAATGVKITWGKVSGAAKYRVYYKTGSGGWTKVGETTKTSYSWTGAKSGVKYSFTVRAVNAAGAAGGYDKTGKSVTYVAAPTVKVANAANGIQVTWNKVAGASRYRLYYKVGANGKWVANGTTAKTSYTWKKAVSGKTYYFTVRATNAKDVNLSAYRSTAALKYVAAPTVKIAKTANGIKVTWNKVAGASKYTVYYKVGSGGWHKIGTTAATSYTWKKAVSGKTYAFTVRCTDANKVNISAYKASNALKYRK